MILVLDLKFHQEYLLKKITTSVNEYFENICRKGHKFVKTTTM